uniref:Mitochondrial carrier protein n=1 Tax=Chromera velia CCMP2878 TaxID=1169474 RepID=A0A0G4IAU7_9ALVE|eukprot:Cvel_12673.t1-p1 / transcript=Cvel_12673.t1 / gene=Cvel_12673 / organism=Chromera_velia_CCMP2878 / gene_product=hypothetical protein / transcript_product=hypothetical protein / location=Cvel_scaffold838:2617-4662(+) / protein_length=422 / sequence_SO=supercontig / SO=protein_coding / is_pseudo=false
MCQAGALHPWDRALYLSMKENRPFLHLANWKHPFQGFFTTIGSRAVANGLYFPLESLFQGPADTFAQWLSEGATGWTQRTLDHPSAPVQRVPSSSRQLHLPSASTEEAAGPHTRALSAIENTSASSSSSSAPHLPAVAAVTPVACEGPRKAKNFPDSSSSPSSSSSIDALEWTNRDTESNAQAGGAPASSVSCCAAVGPGPPTPGAVKSNAGALVAGTLAGFANGLVFHPVSVVKFAAWGGTAGTGGQSAGRMRFFHTASEMCRVAGPGVLLRALHATVARDIVFGGVFSVCRHSGLGLRRGRAERGKGAGEGGKGEWKESVVVNATSAVLAVTLSSPLNFVRNMQFAVPLSQPVPSGLKVLRNLAAEVRAQGGGSLKKSLFLCDRLRLGVATLRLAVGMGLSGFLYERCVENEWLLGPGTS